MNKRYVLRAVVFAVAVLFFLPAGYAQKKLKSGMIEFTVTNVKTDVPELALMEGTRRSFAFSPTEVVTEIEMKSGGVKVQKIVRLKTEGETHLYDLGGQKYAVEYADKPQVKSDLRVESTAIEYVTGSTKTIAGYICRKAIATVNDEKILLWVTDKIKAQMPEVQAVFPDLAGFPLEYTLPAAHAHLTFTAQQVSENVPEKIGLIPTDYEVLSAEEFQKKTGMRHLSF